VCSSDLRAIDLRLTYGRKDLRRPLTNKPRFKHHLYRIRTLYRVDEIKKQLRRFSPLFSRKLLDGRHGWVFHICPKRVVCITDKMDILIEGYPTFTDNLHYIQRDIIVERNNGRRTLRQS